MEKYYFIISIFLLFFSTNFSALAQEEVIVREIFFPTHLDAGLTDSFGAARYNREHEGVDIMGEQMYPLYAAVDGTVSYIVIPEASWGYAVTISDNEGYTYHYIHMNNDTPGTDDGEGGVENAYAPGIKRGAYVEAGQLIGWMGDSGNAESAGPHLHFEMRLPDGTAFDPHPSLFMALDQEIDYDVELVLSASPNINTDKGIAVNKKGACESDTLIKLADDRAVYYCGADGKRYVFPNDKVFFSWYEDFDEVEELTIEEIAAIPLGGNITYRPGVKMVKIKTSPKVYAVDQNGVLRWVRARESAIELYGEDWNQKVDDIPDSFFMDYTEGEAI